MNKDGDVEEASTRVQVRFVTKLNPPYKAPPISIAIPTNLTRFGLSALVNSLLKAGIRFSCPFLLKFHYLFIWFYYFVFIATNFEIVD